MRRWLLASLLFAAASGPALADQPASSNEPTVLQLTQTAEKKLTRDVLHVELRAEKTGSDAQTVQAAINQAMTKALDQAKQVQGIEVETGSYSVNHIETQSEWSGFQSLYLSGSDSATVLKLAGVLQAEGLIMSTMGYEASPKMVKSAEDALTTEALSGFEARAASIAQQMHLSVLGYREVTVGNATTMGTPMPRMLGVQTMASPVPPVASPGQATISVSVKADILLGTKPP